MSITYPPEMLPSPDDGENAVVVVINDATDEIMRLRNALAAVLTYMERCDYPCDVQAYHFRERFGIKDESEDW